MHLSHLHCSAFHFTKLREQLASPDAWKALLTFLFAIFLLIGCPQQTEGFNYILASLTQA